MSFKVPRFLSKLFTAKNTEEKDKYAAKYKAWYANDITQEWIESFNLRIEVCIIEEEKLTPSTSFEFQQKVVANREKRLVLRSLIKEMNYKV